MFEFKFTLTEDDYIEFNRFHTRHSPIGKKTRKLSYIIISVAVLLGLGVGLTDTEPENLAHNLIVSAIVCVFIFGLAFLFIKVGLFDKAIIKWQIKFMKKGGKLPFEKDNLLRFEEDYFLIETENSETKQKYQTIENILVSPYAIYLYFGSVQGYILPLRAFESEQQKEEFITFINQKGNLEKK